MAINIQKEMNILHHIKDKMQRMRAVSSSSRYIQWLRSKGVIVGDNVHFFIPKTIRIDITRPCLVKIGNDTRINSNFQLLTHDFSTAVFRVLEGDFINSAGAVTIGNNVWIGKNVTILKGVTIGDNSIIGAGAIVTRSIPEGSVAVGVPCKVVCSIEKYYEKRKQKGLEEAQEYVRCFRSRYGKEPGIDDLWEEFIYFVDASSYSSYPPQFQQKIRFQLGPAFDRWMENHHAPYKSLDDFLNDIK